jgi:PAS domain S-box-containing protein
MDSADKLEAVAKLAGLFAALWAGFRTAVRIHSKIAHSIAQDVEERMGRKLDEKLEPVMKELRPNGGKSLADQVQMVLTKLEHHSGRVRAFNRDTAEGMFESDPNGACVWVNRTYCRITERTEDEVLGWGWLNILHPDEFKTVREHWDSCVALGREYSRVQRYVTPSGEDVIVTVRAQPTKDSHGKVLGFIGFVRLANDCPVSKDRCPVRRAEEGDTGVH